MIKFSTRRNLIYIVFLLVSFALRKCNLIIICTNFEFTNSILFTVLMFLGELCTGLIIHIYHKCIFRSVHKENIISRHSLIYNKSNKINKDSYLKIYLILIILAFFDCVEFKIAVLYLPKIQVFSGSLEDRLCGLVIVFCGLIYCYILKYPLFKHHICSLLVIGISLIIIIITEIIFQINSILMFYNASRFILLILLINVELFLLSMIHLGDKYLLEYNSIKTYKMAIIEGFFGLIFTFIAFLEDNPLVKLKKVYDKESTGSFIFFIFLLFCYCVLSGIANQYRFEVNNLYSPMTVTLLNYFSNPIFMIYNYILGSDFTIGGNKNLFYFLINLILSSIISITGLVFSEIIVLYFCGLEHNTYKQITERSNSSINEMFEFGDMTIVDDI